MRGSRLLSLAGAAALAVAMTTGFALLVPGTSAGDDEELRTARHHARAVRHARAARQARPAPQARAARRAEAAWVHEISRRIAAKHAETRRWERLMTGRRLSPHSSSLAPKRSPAYLRRALSIWTHRAEQARRQAHHPPRLEAWLCIHRHEGAWNDPDAPYYGGLQMDLGFQRSYGPELLARKGTADRWTPLEQIWVAERAYRSGRGFYPWPNTAGSCGLL